MLKMSENKKSTELSIELDFKPNKKSSAISLPENNTSTRTLFLGTLCHALPEGEGDKPIANANGETFLATADSAPDFIEEPMGLEESVSTVVDASLNLVHDPTYTVGHIKKAKFVQETKDESAHIDFVGVLNNDVLETYGVSKQEIEAGEFKISMECYYDKWYYLHGKETISHADNPELDEHVGDTYDNLGVVRVICDPEFSAAGLIPAGGEADENALIKSVASKKAQAQLLDSPRTPNYDGTSTAEWDRPSLSECIEGYFSNHDEERPDDLVEEVGELPQKITSWISKLGLLGKDSADNFGELLILPVVNPRSQSLVKSALMSAKSYVSQVEGISSDLVDSTKNKINNLLEKEFDYDTEGSNDKMGNEFKELTFETEEEFNDFLEEKREEYVKASKVVSKFNELDIEGDDLEEIGEAVADLKEDKEAKADKLKEMKEDQIFKERKRKLESVGIEVDEEEKDDIVDLTDNQLKIVMKAEKKSSASQDSDVDLDINNVVNDNNGDEEINNPFETL